MQFNADIVFLEIEGLYLVCTPNFFSGKFDFRLTYFSLHQMTPLHLAVEGAKIKILKYFISQDVTDICIQDHNGVIYMLAQCYFVTLTIQITTSNIPTISLKCLFLSISGLHCTLQLVMAVTTQCNASLSKELILTSKIKMGYV